MEPPRHSTDLAIALPCHACNGNGGFGMRRPDTGSGGRPSASANFAECSTCEGSGWQLKRPSELTPDQVKRLLSKLPHSHLFTLTPSPS
jgi:hypothetical protein